MSDRSCILNKSISRFKMTFYPSLVKVMTWVCHMFYWSSHSKYPKTRLSDLSCSIMLIAAIIYIYFKWGESSFQKITQKTKTKCTNFYIQINSQKKSARNARISCVHGPGFWPIFFETELVEMNLIHFSISLKCSVKCGMNSLLTHITNNVIWTDEIRSVMMFCK